MVNTEIRLIMFFAAKDGEALYSQQEAKMQYFGTISKITEWSVHFQGKPFNITVIQIYVLITNAKEAEVEWFCDYKTF